MRVIYISNSNLLEVRGLRNRVTGAYLNAATVTATLKTASGVNVSGQVWPITLSYVAASDGEYRGTLSEALVIVHGEQYFAEVSADGGAGLKGHWRRPLKGQWRTDE